MTTPATEKAAPIPADGPANTVARILAWHHGRPVPTERDRVVAAEIIEAMGARDPEEERIREDERDRLTSLAFDQSISTHPYRNKHWAEGAKCWLRENGAMFPVQRARLRGDAS